MSAADNNEKDAWGKPYPPPGTLMRGLPLTNPADGAFDKKAREALGNAVDSMEKPDEDLGFNPGPSARGPTPQDNAGIASSSPLNFPVDPDDGDDEKGFAFLHENSPPRRGRGQQASGAGGNGQGKRPNTNVHPSGNAGNQGLPSKGFGTQGQPGFLDFGQPGNGGNQQAHVPGFSKYEKESFNPFTELSPEGREAFYRLDAQGSGPVPAGLSQPDVYSGHRFSQQISAFRASQRQNTAGPPSNVPDMTQPGMPSGFNTPANAGMQPQRNTSFNTGMPYQQDMSFNPGMQPNPNVSYNQGYSHGHPGPGAMNTPGNVSGGHPMRGRTNTPGHTSGHPMQGDMNPPGNGSGNPMQRAATVPVASSNQPLQGQIDFGTGAGIRPSQGLMPPPQATQQQQQQQPPPPAPRTQGQARPHHEPGKPPLRRPYECKMAVVLLIVKLVEPAMYHEDVARVLRAVVPNASPDGARPFTFAPQHVGPAMDNVKRVFKPPTQPNHQIWLKTVKLALREDRRAYLLLQMFRDIGYWEQNHDLFFQGAGGYLPDGRRDLDRLWCIFQGFLAQAVLWDAARRGEASRTAVAAEWQRAPGIPNLMAPEMMPFRVTAQASRQADDTVHWQDHPQPMELDEAAAHPSAPSGDDVKNESGAATGFQTIAHMNTMSGFGSSTDQPQEE